MKNLKKVLAMVLVVAMVASFAVTASAKTFQDDASINADYALAVDALTGMEVISGYTDDTFRPTNDITRAEVAKMVAYVMNSGVDAPTSYASAAATAFTDVLSTEWYAAGVGYVVTKGIVDGFTDGTFRPTDNVTGVQTAKMLLVGLGFDGTYTGAGWDLNVISDGSDAGLFEGLESVDLTANLTREQTAQMIWNALNYSAKGATASYVVEDENGVVLYSGTDAMVALAVKSTDDDNTLSVVAITTDSLGYTKFALTKTTVSDDFGRESTAYTNGKDSADTNYKVYATVDSEPVLTYTTETTDGKIAAALGATASKTVSLTVVTDGLAAAATDVNKTGSNPIGGQGTLVEVYKTATDAYKVIVINTYVATLAADDITAAVAATTTTDAEAAFITIDEVDYETDAFAEDDVVLYTKVVNGDGAATKIVNVVKADYVSGYVTATSSSYIRVDGTQKYLSAKNSASIGDAGYVVSSTTAYTYYLDSYGNIILAVEGETAEPDTKYTYVIDAKSSVTNGTAGSNLFTQTEGSAAAQVQVIDLATGEIKVLNVGIVKNTSGKYVYAKATGAAGTTEVDADNVAGFTTKGIYAYTELDDGSIVLAAATLNKVTLEKDKAVVKVADNDDVTAVASSATTLNFVEWTEDASSNIVSATVTTSTGIANFPTTAKQYTALVIDNGKTISSITVVQKKVVETATQYAIYVGEGETDADGIHYNFSIKGETVSVLSADLTEKSLTKGDVVSYTLTNGEIASADDVDKETALATDVKVTVVDDTFIVASGTTYYFASTGYSAFDATEYQAATVAVGSTVTIYGTSSSAIDFILVG
jgi:hypothetical protein